MATLLYRLGRESFRLRWLVLAIWVLIVGGVSYAGATLQQETNPEFVLPGTESQEAFDLLADRFPEMNADGASAQIVFAAEDGDTVTSEANTAIINDAVEAMEASPQLGAAGVTSPFATDPDGNPIGMISPEQNIAVIQVSYAEPGMELDEETTEYLEEVQTEAEDAGLQTEIGGDAIQAVPETGATELIGIGVALLVLVITFGALLSAGLPIITAVLGVSITTSGILAATSFMDVSESTGTLASMIGLAVGIDYALFILSRYRNELAADGRVEDKQARAEAMGRAVGTSGSAVFFAGLTVIVALVGLMVVNIPFLTEMAIAAAVTVLLAVLIAVTLLPAFAGFAGKRVFTGRQRRRIAAGVHNSKPNGGRRWGGFVTRHPILVALVGILGLGALAYPATDLELGLPDAGSQSEETTQRQAYDLISEGFGAGFNGQLMLVGDLAEGTDPMVAAQEVTDEITGLDPDLIVGQAIPNEAGDTLLVSVIPETGPADEATADLVHELRALLADDTDAEWSVTGSAALNIDISDNLNDALIPYLLIVVGLAALILLLVFRSILVPLTATLGFLLSVFAALGALVAVYQWGWLADIFNVDQPGPIMSMMPIMMIGMVFGLAMDYQIFLVTRVREAYVHGKSPKEAIQEGYGHSSRVVVAAALIMISVFAAFIFSAESLVASMGFGLAAAVIFDAFVVRMAVIPAIMALLGRSAWWIPKWLDRIVPNVDVEGEKLQQHLAQDETSEKELVGANR
ncbi:MMPL family transporter [Glycomyces buryatensis]|uniref:MMPL family transporter n=1 Tax=Glycomyces buryatensis TaxID=2570927 RepID=A0A4S8Q0C2_9ACTN|nr:MMPL family transporter [Glycomyces buryatensis]THV33514.1 MMPL family transporter [Glycomyces buryatensis]